MSPCINTVDKSGYSMVCRIMIGHFGHLLRCLNNRRQFVMSMKLWDLRAFIIIQVDNFCYSPGNCPSYHTFNHFTESLSLLCSIERANGRELVNKLTNFGHSVELVEFYCYYVAHYTFFGQTLEDCGCSKVWGGGGWGNRKCVGRSCHVPAISFAKSFTLKFFILKHIHTHTHTTVTHNCMLTINFYFNNNIFFHVCSHIFLLLFLRLLPFARTCNHCFCPSTFRLL